MSKGKIIRCHEDLIEILEELKKKLKDLTYGVVGDDVGTYYLTGILAKKIRGYKE